MNYKKMQSFITLCEEKNYSRAAARLYVAQSSLSAQIKAIEDELGYILIDRKDRSFRLTKQGEIFLSFAQKELNNYELLQTELAASSEKPMIKIGLSNCRRIPSWEQKITAFNQNPENKWSYSARFSYGTEKQKSILNGEFPIALTFYLKDSKDKGLLYKHVFTDIECIGINYNNPLSSLDIITVDDLKDTKIYHISRDRAALFEQSFIDQMIKEGLKSSQFITLNYLDDLYANARTNNGVVLMPDELLPSEVKHIPLKLNIKTTIDYGWCYKKESPEVKWVLDNLI